MPELVKLENRGKVLGKWKLHGSRMTLCFQQEMLVWMSKDSSYLQERILVIINKVLRFTVRKVRKYVSHRVEQCHLILKTAFLQCCFPCLGS